MIPAIHASTAANIRQAFAQARAKGLRAKEAAAAVGVSEGAAVAAHLGLHDDSPKVQLLRADWVPLLQTLELCGPLLALTRNESTVHEKTGVYKDVSGFAAMGLALGEIDLRMFFSRWRAGFSCTEPAANPTSRPARSLQFFDHHGRAVHKIYTRQQTDLDAWDAVLDPFIDAQGCPPSFDPPEAPIPPKHDAAIDVASLLTQWSALKDTHDFFNLLKAHDAERQQAFRLAEGQFTRKLRRTAVREMLMAASFEGTPIMCFVGNPGCIQIHSGPVMRIEPMSIHGVNWLNVIDPGFNLHLREDSIAQVWHVEKPTVDGVVTSVEAFDASGELMASFFGERKPGQPELRSWHQLVVDLPPIMQSEPSRATADSGIYAPDEAAV